MGGILERWRSPHVAPHRSARTRASPHSSAETDRLANAVDWLARRLNVEIVGLERLPRGPALLVANHAFGFWDLALGMARIRALSGRRISALGEHLWSKISAVQRLARRAGVVDGTPANADALLRRGDLVLVLPGGLREALKPRELRYRLLWGDRYGFIRTALRCSAPIVPLACIGGDDLFDLVGNAFARGRRWHVGIPIPRLAHPFSLLRRTHLRFVIGEPISVEGRGSETDARSIRSLRREVEGAIHEIIEAELAERAGFDT